MKKIKEAEITELNDLYRNILKHGEISESGGAGLGLIEIARKSGQHIEFNFDEVDENVSYFSLQVTVERNNNE
ncbi:MAG: hypothetical protein IH946_05385 [Bacteroidetes bacterium]|nr:hypothetical protein [Bacteroidota bacterium]